MGTPEIRALPPSFAGVSNPLGWDGDRLFPQENISAVITVSNPLGWDGDTGPADDRQPDENVSNPLGWDGDLFELSPGSTF